MSVAKHKYVSFPLYHTNFEYFLVGIRATRVPVTSLQISGDPLR